MRPNMLIVNFSHPLTEQQLEAVRALLRVPITEVKTVACQLDHERPFAEQVRQLVDAVGLSAEEWQTVPLLVNLPSLAVIAAAVLAEVHGRTGHWPPVLRLRPVAGSVPARFEVAEVVDLNKVREEARKRR
jgi:hypothetical protein